MAFLPGFRSRYYVGPLRFSAYTKGFDTEKRTNMINVSTLEDTAQVFIPGQVEGSLSADMFLDTLYASTSQFALINTWVTTPQVVTMLPSGNAITSEAQLVLGNQSAATFTAPLTDAVGVNVSVVPDGFIDFGVVIATEAAITIDTNGTSVNNGAATTNGGVAHLHVTAFSGLTSDSVIVEHSTNDSVWATLATFTLVSGVTSERLVIAPGTTVNQYLRIRDDVTGTGSCTRFAAFARR